jgi:hypothetical protein
LAHDDVLVAVFSLFDVSQIFEIVRPTCRRWRSIADLPALRQYVTSLTITHAGDAGGDLEACVRLLPRIESLACQHMIQRPGSTLVTLVTAQSSSLVSLALRNNEPCRWPSPAFAQHAYQPHGSKLRIDSGAIFSQHELALAAMQTLHQRGRS